MGLADFLKSAAQDRRPWNCSTMPADWCVALGHPDFAARWRDVIEECDCLDVANAAGSLLALWQQGIGDCLPSATPPFQPGDIGVINAYGLEAGGVFTGDKWAIKTQRGLSFSQLRDDAIVAAWRP